MNLARTFEPVGILILLLPLLAVLPVIVCPLAALLVGRGLKDYRWALSAAGNT
jgi:hypothetical protein